MHLSLTYFGFTLFEYIERRQLLQTPSERSRLLNELPKVIADAEVELEETPNSQENVEVVFKGLRSFICWPVNFVLKLMY